jgi:hypothetical protein
MPFDFGYWLTVVPICLPSFAPLTIAAWTLVPVGNGAFMLGPMRR